MAAGTITGLTGENGSGKTTLLRVIAQLVRPTSGVVCADATELEYDEPRHRARVGYLPHRDLLHPAQTIRENLVHAAGLMGLSRAASVAAADREIEAWALERVAERRRNELSRGWVQRAALARTFVHEPTLILLDEPTEALDDSGRDLVTTRLQAATATVVVASHEAQWLEGIAQQVIAMASSERHTTYDSGAQ